MKLGILEEVKEYTDWVNSYMIVERDTGNHHSPNHTIQKKLRICLDPDKVWMDEEIMTNSDNLESNLLQLLVY